MLPTLLLYQYLIFFASIFIIAFAQVIFKGEKGMKKNYTIGLDIGTNSVGWSVIADDYTLIRRKMKILGDTKKTSIKKNFWGVRLFENGLTAQDRRLSRTTRRRLARRRQRILYLQDLFYSEINQLDESFFSRLNESFLVPIDKTETRHPIFGTLEEEVEYHKEFPTIYHLRKNLADIDRKFDLRLIYLALAHIVKFRGHFLIEGEINTENSSVEKSFVNFLTSFEQVFGENSFKYPSFDKWDTEFKTIFTDKISRTQRFETLLKIFPEQKSNGVLAQFLKLIVGNQGNFKTVFKLDDEMKLQFSKEDYEEQLEGILAKIGEEYEAVFVSARSVYEAIELAGILTNSDNATKAKLSASMIQRFDEHHQDLKLLKKYIRKNSPENYQDIFNNHKIAGYAGYIDGKTTQEDFYKYLKKILASTEKPEEFLLKMEQENFLRKQRTFDNGVIPYQIQLEEMKGIIENQGKYYPFLLEQQAKIEKLVTFRIPYYVGPLAKGNSDFSWLARKNSDKISPWNLEEIVDTQQSAINFIERMTNNDTYLPNEKVLPKHSMIYEKFMIYNELTKVRFTDDRGNINNFSGEEKQAIFNTLFKNKRKVKADDLIKFLSNEYHIEATQVEGIDHQFNNSFGTYHDLKKQGVCEDVLDDLNNIEIFEEIVKTLTIFEDRKMLRTQLKKYESILGSEVLKKLERKHYSGWGRLSKKVLTGIRDKQTNKCILDYLIEDDGGDRNINRNFMQLINDNDLSFKAEIEKAYKEETDVSDIHEIVKQIPGSPAIKKGILQSLKIIEEIIRIMGYKPKNIVIEMARENQVSKNSQPRLKALETAMKEFGSSLLKENPVDNKVLQNDRLYLYYLQNGKDMYTGEKLEIHNLSKYDIDHIIPQSFTADNSLNNLVLVSSTKNRGKSNDVPSLEVVKKMEGYWESLAKVGLISEQKLKNLRKAKYGGLTLEDKAVFLQRQLVETRQITKHVARILHQRFNEASVEEVPKENKVNIITLKSALTSQFRQNFGFYKVREINDYHHAHDAYLNSVIAITLLKVYPQLAPEFVYGSYLRMNNYRENKATAKKIFYTNIMKFFTKEAQIIDEETGEILWDQQRALATIKKVMNYRQMNITKKIDNRASNESGRELFKATIEGRGGKGKNKIKTNFKRSDGSIISLDIAKYGGYIEEKEAFIITENGKLKSVKRTDKLANQRYKIFRNQVFLQPNGSYRSVSSLEESGKWCQLFLEEKLTKYIFYLNKYKDLSIEEKEYVDNNRYLFNEIMQIVSSFIEKNHLSKLTDISIPEEMSVEQEIKVIFALLNICRRGTTSENAYTAGLNGKDKTVKINKRIRYNTNKDKLKIGESILIFQSVTGLYETHRRI